MKKLLILLLVFSLGAHAQTKKPGSTKTPGKTATGKEKDKPEASTQKPAEASTLGLTPMELLELQLKPETEIDPVTKKKVFYKDRKRVNDSLRFELREKIRKENKQFWVRTKYPKANSKERIQLCINIASKDTNLTYCTNDSTLRDPEDAKILFEQTKGDTTYMLILVEAFTKNKNDGGLCNGKKETKLFFAKWNQTTNTAKWKQKNISSCAKGITNMTKGAVEDWDKSSPLKVSYHRGSSFYDLTFDPSKPELGFQSMNDSEK